jgi:hypothetical protein
MKGFWNIQPLSTAVVNSQGIFPREVCSKKNIRQIKKIASIFNCLLRHQDGCVKCWCISSQTIGPCYHAF